MKQNNEHQEKGQKKKVLWRLFVVSRESYSSFHLNIEPVVVVSLAQTSPVLVWVRD